MYVGSLDTIISIENWPIVGSPLSTPPNAQQNCLPTKKMWKCPKLPIFSIPYSILFHSNIIRKIFYKKLRNWKQTCLCLRFCYQPPIFFCMRLFLPIWPATNMHWSTFAPKNYIETPHSQYFMSAMRVIKCVRMIAVVMKCNLQYHSKMSLPLFNLFHFRFIPIHCDKSINIYTRTEKGSQRNWCGECESEREGNWVREKKSVRERGR